MTVKPYPVAIVQESAEKAIDRRINLLERLAGTHCGRRDDTATPWQEVGTRMVHQNVEQRSLFSNTGSKYEITDFSEATDTAERKETLVIHGSDGSDVKAETIEPTPKLIATKLEIEKLQLTITQEKVRIKAMTSTMVELKKRVEFLKSKNRLVLRRNGEMLQRSRVSQNLSSDAKKSLVESAPNKFIGIAVKVENTVHEPCEK